MSEHTKGPLEAKDWTVFAAEPIKVICHTAYNNKTRTNEAKANAKRLALCWNLHDELVAALTKFIAINQKHGYEFDSNEPELYREIKAVLAKVREKV